MQFQNPGILYFLFFLIIPVIVHLFQLQKFVKVPFTNVAFLEKIIQDNRKSSSIKKWLILATRMLLFSAILFAFSQPYFSNKSSTQKAHIFIYLDNSLSTKALGKKGELLQVSMQEILENASKNSNYSLQTNSNFYENITYEELRKKLKNSKYSREKLNLETNLLKINTKNKNPSNTLSNVILISDFQNIYKKMFTNVTSNISLYKQVSSKKTNLSIDSAFIDNSATNNTIVKINIKNQGAAKDNIPLALYNKEKLISKQSFSIGADTDKTISFNIQNQPIEKGKIALSYTDTFTFDNTLYFTMNQSKKINILSIGNNSTFLSKIYTKKEFNLTQTSLQNVNYNNLFQQEVIVLNELKAIPEILLNSLYKFSNKGGVIVLIPNSESDLNTYNLLLKKYTDKKLTSRISDSLKITNINFSHPFFKEVFSNTVKNFQYPVVKNYYPINTKNSNNLVSFENGLSFLNLIEKDHKKVYVFASAISRNNSNFLNSPLVVPIFYNIGKLSFKYPKLYYRLSSENNIDVDVSLGKDEVLTLKNKGISYIPPQQTFQNKVSIDLNKNPKEPGFYSIYRKNDSLQALAFNNPKEESLLNFLDSNELSKTNKYITVSKSIESFFKEVNTKNEVHWLWKWFLALAIVSLLLEIMILKFYKA